MNSIPTIPEKAWGHTAKPEVESQTGCVFCLAEGNHAPVDIIYMFKGTSLCFNHAPAYVKANQ